MHTHFKKKKNPGITDNVSEGGIPIPSTVHSLS